MPNKIDNITTGLLDRQTGTSFNVADTTTYYDGSTIDDTKVSLSGGIYFSKLVAGIKQYYKKALDTITTKTLIVENVSQLRNLPLRDIILLQSGYYHRIKTKGYYNVNDNGGADFSYDPTSNLADDGGSSIALNNASGRMLIATPKKVVPEMFGAIGDATIVPSKTGTVNTTALQAMVNYCSLTSRIVDLTGGKKYLTDTIYLYFDTVKNPGWNGRPGRITISGQSNGLATGDIEPQGSALIHIDGSVKSLIEEVGIFSINNAAAMGGYTTFRDMNFIGGNLTTDVIRMQGCQGSILFENLTVKITNPAGNGIVEATTWESCMRNILIRGGASAGAAGAPLWTGIGLWVCSDGTSGQINMKEYLNVNTYKCGTGIKVGRGLAADGTFGPLKFILGQSSLSDQHGMVVGGGVYNLVSECQQIEQSRLNGLRIDSEGSSDLPRNIRFKSPYFTHCGNIADGSYNEFAIQNIDGVQCEISGAIFQNCNSGIAYDQSKCADFAIIKPLFRTITSYGQASGRGIESYGSYLVSARIKLDSPVYYFNFTGGTKNIVDPNDGLAVTDAGGRVGQATTTNFTPSINMGGNTNSQPARILNFNHASATAITSITGPVRYQNLIITFSNTNTTLKKGGNLAINGDFTPEASTDMIVLYYDGGTNTWKERSRTIHNGVIDTSIALPTISYLNTNYPLSKYKSTIDFPNVTTGAVIAKKMDDSPTGNWLISSTVNNFSFTNTGGFTGTINNPTTAPSLSLILQDASNTQSGQVNTASQTFAGAKSFTSPLTGTGSIAINDISGNIKRLYWYTGGILRGWLGLTTTDDFEFITRTDAGTFAATAFTINRLTGLVTIGNGAGTTAVAGDNSTKLATTSFATTADNLRVLKSNQAAGIRTITVDGTSLVYTFPHGLSSIPTVVLVTRGVSTDFSVFATTWNSTTVTITYENPPAAGTVHLNWFAII